LYRDHEVASIQQLKIDNGLIMQIFNKKGVFSILFLSEKTRTDTFFIKNSFKCTTGKFIQPKFNQSRATKEKLQQKLPKRQK